MKQERLFAMVVFVSAMLSAQVSLGQAGGNFSGQQPDLATSADDRAVANARALYLSQYVKPLYDQVAKYNSDNANTGKNRTALRRSDVPPSAVFPNDYLGNYTGACAWYQGYQADSAGNKEVHYFWVDAFTFSQASVKVAGENRNNLKAQFVNSNLRSNDFYSKNVPADLVSGFQILDNYEIASNVSARVVGPFQTAKVVVAEDGSINLPGLSLHKSIGQTVDLKLEVSGNLETGQIVGGSELNPQRGFARRSAKVPYNSGATQIAPTADPFNRQDQRLLLDLTYQGDKFPGIAVMPSTLSAAEAPSFRCVLQKMSKDI